MQCIVHMGTVSSPPLGLGAAGGWRVARTSLRPVRISSSVMGSRHCCGMLKRSKSDGRTCAEKGAGSDAYDLD